MIDIKIYEDSKGYCPLDDYLSSITDKTIEAHIYKIIARMEAGNITDVRLLGDGLKERKFLFKNTGYRIYFYNDSQEIVILLTAGQKKTQKKDINAARIFLEDYRRQKVA